MKDDDDGEDEDENEEGNFGASSPWDVIFKIGYFDVLAIFGLCFATFCSLTLQTFSTFEPRKNTFLLSIIVVV